MIIPFWTEDPAILLNNKYIGEVWCAEGMAASQKLNAISRLVIVMSCLGWLWFQSMNFPLMGVLTLGALVAVHYYSLANKAKLSFDTIGKEGFANQKVIDQLAGSFVEPSVQNPLMNVLVPDYGTDKRDRPAAAAFDPQVESDVNKAAEKQIADMNPGITNLEDRIFKDLGDNYVFNQSMRNFYATPNTTVPNNQTAFAEFCYGNMPSCKEQNALACSKHTGRHINI